MKNLFYVKLSCISFKYSSRVRRFFLSFSFDLSFTIFSNQHNTDSIQSLRKRPVGLTSLPCGVAFILLASTVPGHSFHTSLTVHEDFLSRYSQIRYVKRG